MRLQEFRWLAPAVADHRLGKGRSAAGPKPPLFLRAFLITACPIQEKEIAVSAALANRRSYLLPRLVGAIVLLALLPLTAGCGRSLHTKRLEEGKEEIIRLASVWQRFRIAYNREPVSIEELMAWVKSLPPRQREGLGIGTDVEKAFTSPRDGQRFGLVRVGNRPGGMAQVLFYERVGVNNKRLTSSTIGSSTEMDEQTVRRFVPNL